MRQNIRISREFCFFRSYRVSKEVKKKDKNIVSLTHRKKTASQPQHGLDNTGEEEIQKKILEQKNERPQFLSFLSFPDMHLTTVIYLFLFLSLFSIYLLLLDRVRNRYRSHK